MRTVLGIDAAWTETEPSGVALVVEQGTYWRCVAVAPSYSEFLAQAEGTATNWAARSFPGGLPNIAEVISAAERLAGGPVGIVTIDMPVATVPFSSRRAADRAISQEFGARWCSAHSPSADRPGPLGALLSSVAMEAGFPLVTSPSGLRSRALLEVYPHPALLSLLRREQRVPYKISKAGRFWPKADVRTRIVRLLEQFEAIHRALSNVIGPIPLALPDAKTVPSLAWLKRFEDALDALVCTWVGIEYLCGRAVPLGDATAAIWCPVDVVHAHTATPTSDADAPRPAGEHQTR